MQTILNRRQAKNEDNLKNDNLLKNEDEEYVNLFL